MTGLSYLAHQGHVHLVESSAVAIPLERLLVAAGISIAAIILLTVLVHHSSGVE